MTTDKAIEFLTALIEWHKIDPLSVTKGDVEALQAGIKALENEPKRGKWIKHISSLECSECKVKFFCGDEDENVQDYDPCNELNFKFCPNCGADLREVVNE